MSLLEELRKLQSRAEGELAEARSPEALEGLRIKYLGAKGATREMMRRLGEVSPDDRPAAGKAANACKNAITAAYEARAAELDTAAVARPAAAPPEDVTLPGDRPTIGHMHVITQTINEICDIFSRMGFVAAYGLEVEDERHNFDALNIPPHHPARDSLDNFYIDEATMLRSQTSTVQIRIMENAPPPVRIISPGRVYRPDTVDATHSYMFHQVEGLYVDQGVTMADLKSCLDQFCKAYFGPSVQTRLRPHFFPFTEPSAELDVQCVFCKGDGCAVCKQSGWIELAGCGMVHPNVFEAVGYDPERYTGYAFGLGIDRGVMQKHDIPDIRLLFENDVRFLHQF